MIIVTRKETLASLALLALAGIFLYLGFTQERRPTEASKPPVEAAAATPQKIVSPSLPPPAPNPLEGEQGGRLKEKSGREFFVEYRLERDRIRSQEIQMLKGLLDHPNSSAEARNEAQRRLIRLTEYMDQEMQLEALLEAKGYPEAAVFIQPSTVNVVVRASKLEDQDVARIGELVARTTGRRTDEVIIIPWP